MTTVMKSMALFKIVPEYCRAVRFNFGKFDSVLKPGIRLRIPVYHQIIEVDMRETMADVPKQTLISKDCISFTATGSIQYRIIDAEKAVINVDNIHSSYCKIIITILTSWWNGQIFVFNCINITQKCAQTHDNNKYTSH